VPGDFNPISQHISGIASRSITWQGVLASVFVGARVRCCLHTGKTVKLAYMLARKSLLPVVQTCLLAGEHDAGTLGRGLGVGCTRR